MKQLKLTTGQITYVDDDVYEEVSKFNWRLDPTNKHVVRTIGPKNKRRSLRLHRFVIKAQTGQLVDHIDGNTLNNTRDNLRFADKSTNGMNRDKQINNTSGYKGVTFHKQMNKWHAQLCCKGKQYSLGLFELAIDAAKAYNEAALLHFGEFARLNKIEENSHQNKL